MHVQVGVNVRKCRQNVFDNKGPARGVVSCPCTAFGRKGFMISICSFQILVLQYVLKKVINIFTKKLSCYSTQVTPYVIEYNNISLSDKLYNYGLIFSLFKFMKIYEIFWKFMTIYENFMKVDENLKKTSWYFLKIYEKLNVQWN